MKAIASTFLALACLLLLMAATTACAQTVAGDVTVPKDVAAVLKKFCAECHGEQTREAEVRLDALASLEKTARIDVMGKAQEQIAFGLMPPRDASQPSAEQRQLVADCYGNRIVKTPNIDRLAARGMVFERAYCQQAVCSPSRTAIMTGLRPDVTKVWDLETHFRVARPDCVTLPQHFKANGYHCSALGKVYHNGFEDGRSWNEPHWYSKGRAVDTDPVDWTKQIVTRHNIDVEEFANPLQDGSKDSKGDAKTPAGTVRSKTSSSASVRPRTNSAIRRSKQSSPRRRNRKPSNAPPPQAATFCCEPTPHIASSRLQPSRNSAS